MRTRRVTILFTRSHCWEGGGGGGGGTTEELDSNPRLHETQTSVLSVIMTVKL